MICFWTDFGFTVLMAKFFMSCFWTDVFELRPPFIFEERETLNMFTFYLDPNIFHVFSFSLFFCCKESMRRCASLNPILRKKAMTPQQYCSIKYGPDAEWHRNREKSVEVVMKDEVVEDKNVDPTLSKTEQLESARLKRKERSFTEIFEKEKLKKERKLAIKQLAKAKAKETFIMEKETL
jgi:hypothetical protein